MKSYIAKPGEVERKWYVIDLAGQRVGRVATKVASMLRGKHRPEYTPHTDAGDFVIVVNADKAVFSGTKMQKKMYYTYSGYPGGIRGLTAEKLMQRHPEDIFRLAVRGMLPKTSLGRKLMSKLKIYTGPEHPHAAQQPEVLEP
ncbi:MAG: 50S ribosomal protein L13 [Myxococcota bacterium]|jgi:large subunit ribosomal protein L13|nr:50S ribosomal protein L13 [Myxococcota bacterium]